MKKIILIGLLALFLQGCWEVSKGEKIGTIVKLAKEGLIIGTWEAELIRGGINNGSGSFGTTFHFTIENSALVEIASKALNQQQEVIIKYHKELITLWRAESDNYFLDSIEIVNK